MVDSIFGKKALSFGDIRRGDLRRAAKIQMIL